MQGSFLSISLPHAIWFLDQAKSKTASIFSIPRPTLTAQRYSTRKTDLKLLTEMVLKRPDNLFSGRKCSNECCTILFKWQLNTPLLLANSSPPCGAHGHHNRRMLRCDLTLTPFLRCRPEELGKWLVRRKKTTYSLQCLMWRTSELIHRLF